MDLLLQLKYIELFGVVGTTPSVSVKPYNGTPQARQTQPNSGGVAEGHPRFDKGGVTIIFYFLRVKNRTF